MNNFNIEIIINQIQEIWFAKYNKDENKIVVFKNKDSYIFEKIKFLLLDIDKNYYNYYKYFF